MKNKVKNRKWKFRGCNVHKYLSFRQRVNNEPSEHDLHLLVKSFHPLLGSSEWDTACPKKMSKDFFVLTHLGCFNEKKIGINNKRIFKKTEHSDSEIEQKIYAPLKKKSI